MASVNKQSVREEAERIQSEFNKLSANKKISSESMVLFQSMLILINLYLYLFSLRGQRIKIIRIPVSHHLKPRKTNHLLRFLGLTARVNLRLQLPLTTPEP